MYSFYLPVALAMLIQGIDDERDFNQAKEILVPLGEYFQIQDDYLDCYGDPNIIGKIGTDIVDNKCSWLINKAISKANEEQRKKLDNCYGIKDEKREEEVKAVFRELELEKDFLAYEEEIVSKLRNQIASIDESRGFKRDCLTAFLDKIYKRSK